MSIIRKCDGPHSAVHIVEKPFQVSFATATGENIPLGWVVKDVGDYCFACVTDILEALCQVAAIRLDIGRTS